MSRREMHQYPTQEQKFWLYRVCIPLPISFLHVEDADQIRESKEWTEKGKAMLTVSGSSIIVHFQLN